MIPRRWNAVWLFTGLAALLLGATVYALDRPVEQLALPFFSFDRLPEIALSFGQFGGSLPTFVHVFAFALMTAAVLDVRTPTSASAVCAAWAIVDAVFEVGQLIVSAGTRAWPWVEASPVIASAHRFFAAGTFDPWDLISIALGAVAAFSLIVVTRKRGVHS